MRKNMWSMAGVEGLKLGLVSAAYLFASILLEKSGMPLLLTTILAFVLWAAKFAGCILLMRYAMLKFAASESGISNKDSFRFGMATALLSALVFSAISFANVAFLSADMYSEQINNALQQMAPMMDSNSLSMVDRYMEKLPQITFFSNLIYCFLFGTVLSSILSKNIPSTDPFADYKPQE